MLWPVYIIKAHAIIATYIQIAILKSADIYWTSGTRHQRMHSHVQRSTYHTIWNAKPLDTRLKANLHWVTWTQTALADIGMSTTLRPTHAVMYLIWKSFDIY